MGGKGKRGRYGQLSAHHRGDSLSSVQSPRSTFSTAIVNPRFFESEPSTLHTQSQTWKSGPAREHEQWDRTKTLLTHFAPEQHKQCAKPTKSPAELLPKSYAEYIEHKAEMQAMAIEKAKKELATMIDRAKIPKKDRVPIMPAFNQKTFQSDRSSVLSQKSVWTTNFEATYEHGVVAWPGREQLHEDGEKRENIHAPTRCGRYLPALRHPDTGVFMSQYPLDQVGPLRSQGPTPAECVQSNGAMDLDPDFEEEGVRLLGAGLMEDIGARRAPFVPDWLAERRYQKDSASGRIAQYGTEAPAY